MYSKLSKEAKNHKILVILQKYITKILELCILKLYICTIKTFNLYDIMLL